MGAEIDPGIFRGVLAHLPTGVSLVTSYDEGVPVGMACNSVTSVSLDPPLVLFCAAKSSTTWPRIRRSGRFCINVMASHHEELCRTFALRNVNRFADVAWHDREQGPGIDDAVAHIDCAIDACHDAGDHVIVIGAVEGLHSRPEARPLLFFRGGYSGL